jgi:antitoxin (DNA-binding transcriptional repressor) of toxin-antitoxin stability system
MAITPTEFRKNVFQFLQRALDGETIEIEQKGQVVQLVPKIRRSKLDRLVRRDILACAPEELEQVQRELSENLRLEWEHKWALEK